MLRWPPCNDCFVMGFGPDDAREIRARGWLRLNGRLARVLPASLADDDLRIDFQFSNDQAAADRAAA